MMFRAFEPTDVCYLPGRISPLRVSVIQVSRQQTSTIRVGQQFSLSQVSDRAMPSTPGRRKRRRQEKREQNFLNRTDEIMCLASTCSGDEKSEESLSPVPHLTAPEINEYPEFVCSDSDNSVFDDDDWSVPPSTSSDSDSEEDLDLRKELCEWAREGVSFRKVDGLLAILRRQGHSDLPRTSRNLLQTPCTSSIKVVENGQILHVGVSEALRKSCEISVNVDGVPIFKSSSRNFWTVLAWSKDLSYPEVVTVFFGRGKPKVEDLLRGFIEDFRGWRGRFHFVCDAPARAYIKCVSGHTSKKGCDRCTASGSYMKRRVAYPLSVGEKRTDEAFRAKLYDDHHQGSSPLLELPVDMVSAFTIDHMHLLYLGVTRKVLHFLVARKASCQSLKPAQRTELSNWLISVKNYIPSDFARKPRGINELDRWKATEFRLFLLYLVPSLWLLFDKSAVWKHLMLLSFVMRGVYRKELTRQTVSDLTHRFVIDFARLYGREYVSYNVHMINHLSEDLDGEHRDAFMFENHLQSVKRVLRSPKQPLRQLENRLHEGGLKTNKKSLVKFLECNSTYMFDGLLLRVKKITDGGATVEAQLFNTLRSFSYRGLSPGVYTAVLSDICKTVMVPISAKKCVAIPVKDLFVICEILHFGR